MASSSVVISRRQNLWGRTIAQLSRDLGAWLYVALVLGLVTVLAFIYLAQASYVARQIDQMVQLETSLAELHEENSALLLRIAKYESMSRIKTEARAMGLSEARQLEYIEVVLDDAGPASQRDVVQDLPTSAVTGGQQFASLPNEPPPVVGVLRLAPTIAQQFQGWICGGTAGRDAE
jgi:cell division protein FtsL